MRGRRKPNPEENGHVDEESIFRAPATTRGKATLDEAIDAGRRLGHDEVRRRQLEGPKADEVVAKAVRYAEFLWKEQGRVPL